VLLQNNVNNVFRAIYRVNSLEYLLRPSTNEMYNINSHSVFHVANDSHLGHCMKVMLCKVFSGKMKSDLYN